jgi:hypothetical protein
LPKDANIKLSGAKLAQEGKLLAPEVVAEFLSWLMLETTNEQFGNGIFDIYDKWHQQYWNTENIIEKPI